MKLNQENSRLQKHKALGAAVGLASAAMTSQACEAAIIIFIRKLKPAFMFL